MLSREWRCGWCSADSRCSSYTWMINNVMAYWGALILDVLQYVRNWATAPLHRLRIKNLSAEHKIPFLSATVIYHDNVCWAPLQRLHNERDGVSDQQPHDCLLNRLFRRRSNKTSNLRVAGLCEGNSTVTGEFPAQRASNTENVSIWWRHHVSGRMSALLCTT